MLSFKETKYVKIIPKSKFILAGDLGGTNATFAVLTEDFKLLLSLRYNSQEITNFTAIVVEVLNYLQSKYKITISEACFAAACPIHEDGLYCSLTNADWDVDALAIMNKSKLPSLAIINDFEAIAYGIALLPKQDLLQIKRGKIVPKKPQILLGAGTGLGKSVLVWNNSERMYFPLESEGGHADLVIANEEELALVNFIRKLHQIKNVTWEYTLSGQGISNIYQFLQSKTGLTKRSKEIKNSNFDAELISKHKNEDELCKKTFHFFSKFYGRCIKNYSLDFLSRGGIYIGGGIAAKNLDIFNQEFMDEFLNNKKMNHILRDLPIFLIKNYDVSLYGAAKAAVLKRKGVI